jgi:HAD superfamily hydrolase (TIGR01549 family)
MRSAVTFDFHNTLIRCDPWFDLEVKDLPSEVARALTESGSSIAGTVTGQELTDTYRGLRSEIISHGHELDAVEGVAETFRRIGLHVDIAAITEIVDSKFRALVPASSLMPGVRQTLAHLHEQGIPIGIVSSAVHHEFLEWTLAYHGLRGYLADVVTSASCGFYKSRPEIYYTACERLGSDPASTIHVGDSFRFDHLCGQAAGLRTVLISEHDPSDAINEAAPSLKLTTLVGAGPSIFELTLARGHAD